MVNGVVIYVDGSGEPKLLVPPHTVNNHAFSEAYDLLKRGVLGHFQFIPIEATEAKNLDISVQDLLP